MIDISWPITEKITTYKNRKFVKFTPTKIFEKNKARETKLNLHTHIGTHIDSPSHLLKKGKTIDKIEPIIGECKVLDFTKIKDKITKKDLEKKT